MSQNEDYSIDIELINKVRQFLAEELTESPIRILLETRLEEDLGVTGDSAEELLQAFAKRFDVDFTEMEFHKHFGPEGLPIFMPPLFKEFGNYPVTVKHLVKVAQAHYWFEPPKIHKNS